MMFSFGVFFRLTLVDAAVTFAAVAFCSPGASAVALAISSSPWSSRPSFQRSGTIPKPAAPKTSSTVDKFSDQGQDLLIWI